MSLIKKRMKNKQLNYKHFVSALPWKKELKSTPDSGKRIYPSPKTRFK